MGTDFARFTIGTALKASLIEAQRDLLEPVWPEGRNPSVADGNHFTAKGFDRPVSISGLESHVLAQLAFATAPRRIVEIGTAFGYSSTWLALGALAASSDVQVTTIDNLSEGGLGETGQRIAANMHAALGLSHSIDRVVGTADAILSAALLGDESIDLAFIDGDHHGDAPLRDYQAVARSMSSEGMIVFHDVDAARYTVPQAVDAAMRDGWQCIPLDTSCYLTIAGRRADTFALVEEVLSAASLSLRTFNES